MDKTAIFIDEIQYTPNVPEQLYFFEVVHDGLKQVDFKALKQLDNANDAGSDGGYIREFSNKNKRFLVYAVSRESIQKHELSLTSEPSLPFLKSQLSTECSKETFKICDEPSVKGKRVIASHLVHNKHFLSEETNSEYLVLVTDINELIVFDLKAFEIYKVDTDILNRLCKINMEKYDLVKVKKSSFHQVNEIVFTFQRKFLLLDQKSPVLVSKTFSEYDFEVNILKLTSVTITNNKNTNNNNKRNSAIRLTSRDITFKSPAKLQYNDQVFVESFQLDQDYFVYLTSDPTQTTYKLHTLSTVDMKTEGTFTFEIKDGGEKNAITSDNFALSTFMQEPLLSLVTREMLILYTVVTPDEQLWYLKNAIIELPDISSLGIDKILHTEFSDQDNPQTLFVYGTGKMLKISLVYDHQVFGKTQISKIQKFDLETEILFIKTGYSITKDFKICFYNEHKIYSDHKFDFASDTYFQTQLLNSTSYNNDNYSLSGVSFNPWSNIDFYPYHFSKYKHIVLDGFEETESSSKKLVNQKSFDFDDEFIDHYWSKDKKTIFFKTKTGVLYSNFEVLNSHIFKKSNTVEKILFYTKYCEWLVSHEESQPNMDILISSNHYNKFKNTELILYLNRDGVLKIVEMDCETFDVIKIYPAIKVVEEQTIVRTAVMNDTFQLTMNFINKTESNILIVCNLGAYLVENFTTVCKFKWPSKLKELTICDVCLNTNNVLHVTTLSGEVFEMEMLHSRLFSIIKHSKLTTSIASCQIIKTYHNRPAFYLLNNTFYDIDSLLPLSLPYFSFWFCLQDLGKAENKWSIYTRDHKIISFEYNKDTIVTKLADEIIFKETPRSFFEQELLLNSPNFRFSLVAYAKLTLSDNHKEFSELQVVDLLCHRIVQKFDSARMCIPENAHVVAMRPIMTSNSSQWISSVAAQHIASSEQTSISDQVKQVFKKCFLICISYRDSGKKLKSEFLIFQFNELGLVNSGETLITLEHKFLLPHNSRITHCDNFDLNEMSESPQFVTIDETGGKPQFWNIKYHPAEHRFEVLEQSHSQKISQFSQDSDEGIVRIKSYDEFVVLPSEDENSKIISMIDSRNNRFQLIKHDCVLNTNQWLTKTEQLMYIDSLTSGQFSSLNIQKILKLNNGIYVLLVDLRKDILILQSPIKRLNETGLIFKKQKSNKLKDQMILEFEHKKYDSSQPNDELAKVYKITYNKGHIKSIVAILGPENQQLIVKTSDNYTYTVHIKIAILKQETKNRVISYVDNELEKEPI